MIVALLLRTVLVLGIWIDEANRSTELDCAALARQAPAGVAIDGAGP